MISNCSRIKAIILTCFMIITVNGRKQGKIGEIPANWPEQWATGVIPFVFDYYSSNLKRLINTVRRGVKLMENKGCLKFEEKNPILMAREFNNTYLYYTYSGVLEECCGVYFNNDIGRRLVLITPMCRSPAEIVHATLHAMGLRHDSGSRFLPTAVNAVLFLANCVNYDASYADNSDGDHANDSKVSKKEEKEKWHVKGQKFRVSS